MEEHKISLWNINQELIYVQCQAESTQSTQCATDSNSVISLGIFLKKPLLDANTYYSNKS